MGWFSSGDDGLYQVVIKHAFWPDEVVLDRVSMSEAESYRRQHAYEGKELIIQPSGTRS